MALDRGLPVVIATRVPTGGTGAVYGGPGGGVTLRDAGVIPAGSLTAGKARLLLMLLLARGDDPRAGFEDALGTLGCST
jgi:L-asparaginase